MPRPNILVLMTDQQRADTLDADSPCLTPNLDALAARGTRFSRCYTPSPICSPARASLFTGLLPHSHGMVDVTHAVPSYRADLQPDLPTWSNGLHDLGYRTGYFGKWHVERSGQLERYGFDEYEVYPQERSFGAVRGSGMLPPETRFGLRHDVRHPGYRDLLLYGTHDQPVEATMEHYVYSRGASFVEAAAGQDQPWCLMVSTHAPHEPYVVPESYYRRYDPATLSPPASFTDDLADRPGIYRRQQDVWRDLPWERFAEATACYYAYCSLVDDQVGRLLRTLADTGQADDTVVVMTSDHGDLMGAHRLLLKGFPAFEEVYRVPLVVAGPGLAAGVTSDDIVQLHDLAPTLVELAGGEPFDCHGRSLVPQLTGAGGGRGEAYAEFHGQRFSATQRVVWDERYKYVFNGFDYDELYDLTTDPHELTNLAHSPSHRHVSQRLCARMFEIARETADHTLHEAEDGTYRYAPIGPRGTAT